MISSKNQPSVCLTEDSNINSQCIDDLEASTTYENVYAENGSFALDTSALLNNHKTNVVLNPKKKVFRTNAFYALVFVVLGALIAGTVYVVCNFNGSEKEQASALSSTGSTISNAMASLFPKTEGGDDEEEKNVEEENEKPADKNENKNSMESFTLTVETDGEVENEKEIAEIFTEEKEDSKNTPCLKKAFDKLNPCNGFNPINISLFAYCASNLLCSTGSLFYGCCCAEEKEKYGFCGGLVALFGGWTCNFLTCNLYSYDHCCVSCGNEACCFGRCMNDKDSDDSEVVEKKSAKKSNSKKDKSA